MLLLAALALLAAPRGVEAATVTPGASCVTGSVWCSVAFTSSRNNPTTSPAFMGVNLGHHHPADSTWLAFIEHLGVNSASPALRRAFPPH